MLNMCVLSGSLNPVAQIWIVLSLMFYDLKYNVYKENNNITMFDTNLQKETTPLI